MIGVVWDISNTRGFDSTKVVYDIIDVRGSKGIGIRIEGSWADKG